MILYVSFEIKVFMNQKLISDIKSYVNYLLLPLDKLYYHHYDHALSVMERALYLGKEEGVSEDELEMLAIAALFHDTWFVIQYDENEYIGAKIARNYLMTVLYNIEKISVIESIILATSPSAIPYNLLEKIIKDADMDNLGTNEFFNISEKIKHEREIIQHIKIQDPDWHHASLDLIEWHTFYTNTQIRERNEKLRENTEMLRKEVKKKKL